jgi:chemotaxis methyl-accepting protein methylase
MMAHEFGLVRRILKEHFGLNLGEDKQDLLEGKLRPLLREFALPSLSHLVLAMMKPDAHHLRSRVAQAVTVQESYFFRRAVPLFHRRDAAEAHGEAGESAPHQGLVRRGSDRTGTLFAGHGA